jgi:hypothetical protein
MAADGNYRLKNKSVSRTQYDHFRVHTKRKNPTKTRPVKEKSGSSRLMLQTFNSSGPEPAISDQRRPAPYLNYVVTALQGEIKNPAKGFYALPGFDFLILPSGDYSAVCSVARHFL